VRSIVERALQVDRAKRFPTADEMRNALERALHASPVSSDEISAAASRLTSSATTPRHEGADAHAETELAVPTAPPKTLKESAKQESGTLVSARTGRAESPPAPKSRSKKAEGDSLKTMTMIVAGAALVTIGAAALAFCG
jgi:hypothetical protein